MQHLTIEVLGDAGPPAELLSKDEGRIAANIAKLPELIIMRK